MKINELPDLNSSLKNNSLLVVVNNNTNSTKKTNIGSAIKVGFPIFCKIKTEDDQESRSFYSEWHEPEGYVTPDNILFFDPLIDGINLGDSDAGFFQVQLNAFFTGAPPVAYINEPSQSELNFYFLKEKHYKCAFTPKIDQQTFTGITNNLGYIVTTEEVKSLNQINTNFSDTIEPEFFYENDLNAYGYFVEINYMTHFGSGEGEAERGVVKFRWCSSVDGANTTLKSGSLKIKKLIY